MLNDNGIIYRLTSLLKYIEDFGFEDMNQNDKEFWNEFIEIPKNKLRQKELK